MRADQAVLDHVFWALSDATRRDVRERLARGPESVSELAQPLGMSLPGFLKHLRVLADAGLVTCF
jgi:DNA-binding transcriptional ArsR family regulator